MRLLLYKCNVIMLRRGDISTMFSIRDLSKLKALISFNRHDQNFMNASQTIFINFSEFNFIIFQSLVDDYVILTIRE